MYPVVCTIFGRTVTGYWAATMVALAVTHAFVSFCNRRNGERRVPFVHIHMLNCLAILSIYIGGAVMGLLVGLPEMLENPGWDMFSNRAFYGGFVLLILSFWWYIRRYGLDFETIAWLFVPACPLFMVFGRIGCFLGGCCYGIPVSWGVTFPVGSLAPAGIPLFPSQLAEAFGHLCLFFLLLKLRRKGRPVDWICACAAGYAALRFALEFFRGDTARGGLWLLSTSQWLSLTILAISGFCWNLFKKRGIYEYLDTQERTNI